MATHAGVGANAAATAATHDDTRGPDDVLVHVQGNARAGSDTRDGSSAVSDGTPAPPRSGSPSCDGEVTHTVVAEGQAQSPRSAVPGGVGNGDAAGEEGAPPGALQLPRGSFGDIAAPDAAFTHPDAHSALATAASSGEASASPGRRRPSAKSLHSSRTSIDDDSDCESVCSCCNGGRGGSKHVRAPSEVVVRSGNKFALDKAHALSRRLTACTKMPGVLLLKRCRRKTPAQRMLRAWAPAPSRK